MKPAIGMSVPGASDLGLGGGFGTQDETDEEKRKRLLEQQQQRLLPNTAGASSLLGSGYSAIGGIGGV